MIEWLNKGKKMVGIEKQGVRKEEVKRTKQIRWMKSTIFIDNGECSKRYFGNTNFDWKLAWEWVLN